MKEHRVGIRQLKSDLSPGLREVKSGNAILITERGKPIGRILPAEASLEEVPEEGSRKKMWVWSGRKWRRTRLLMVRTRSFLDPTRFEVGVPHDAPVYAGVARLRTKCLT